jgi:KUP system potassium uptake protein
VTVEDLDLVHDGIIFVRARYGYLDRPDVPAALRLLDLDQTEGPIDLDDASYFLSKLELVVCAKPTMSPWRTRLFVATSYITADAAAHFKLPVDRTVIIGARLEV